MPYLAGMAYLFRASQETGCNRDDCFVLFFAEAGCAARRVQGLLSCRARLRNRKGSRPLRDRDDNTPAKSLLRKKPIKKSLNVFKANLSDASNPRQRRGSAGQNSPLPPVMQKAAAKQDRFKDFCHAEPDCEAGRVRGIRETVTIIHPQNQY